MSLINISKSIIVACDVELDHYKKILNETKDIAGISAYKIGVELALKYGLPKVVDIAKDITDKPIIYDHQKACTDIPNMGYKFIKVCKDSGLDSIIFFPQSGPETETSWIKAANDLDMHIIVGGYMSHPKYLVSEGGYIQDDRMKELYGIAYELGVKDFIIPSTKLSLFQNLDFLAYDNNINYFITGLILQGGKIKEVNALLKQKYHCIIGHGIYEASDIKKTSLKLLEELK